MGCCSGLKRRVHTFMYPPNTTPLDYKVIICVCIVIFVEGFGLTMIYPFLAEMVESFGYPPEDVGFVSGFVAGSFSLAQFLTSSLWGYLSDRFGRRVVLLIGMAGGVGALLMLGFSEALWFAIVARAIHGSLSSNIGVSKALLNDITDDTNQGRAFASLGLSFGVSLCVAPALSGLLSADPALYPIGHFLNRFPYAITCIVSAALNLLGTILCFFWLPKRIEQSQQQQQQQDQTTTSDEVVVEEKTPLIDADSTPPVSFRDRFVFLRLLRDRSVVLVMLMYGSFSFTHMLYTQVFAIWAVLEFDSTGRGLDFTPSEIGYFYLAAGLSGVISQTFAFAPLVRKIGARKTWVICSFLTTLVYAVPALTNMLLPAHPAIMWVLLLLSACIFQSCVMLAFTAIMMMVNNTSNDASGAVNGLAQGVAALTRGFGPMIAPPIFAWSITQDKLPFPFDRFFIFLVGIIINLVTLLIYFCIPQSLDRKKRTEVVDDEPAMAAEPHHENDFD